MGYDLAFRLVPSFNVCENPKVFSYFKGEWLSGKLEFINVAIMVDWFFRNYFKFCLNWLLFRRVLHFKSPKV